MSDSQIRQYQEQADRLVEQSHEKSRKKLFRRHLAQRRNLYARAVTTGETRTALACLRDEAELLRLYDSRPKRPQGEAGGEIDRKARLAQSVAFYDAVVCSSDAPLAERMKAQERIDRLLGLECADLEERLAAMEQALAANDNVPGRQAGAAAFDARLKAGTTGRFCPMSASHRIRRLQRLERQAALRGVFQPTLLQRILDADDEDEQQELIRQASDEELEALISCACRPQERTTRRERSQDRSTVGAPRGQRPAAVLPGVRLEPRQ